MTIPDAKAGHNASYKGLSVTITKQGKIEQRERRDVAGWSGSSQGGGAPDKLRQMGGIPLSFYFFVFGVGSLISGLIAGKSRGKRASETDKSK